MAHKTAIEHLAEQGIDEHPVVQQYRDDLILHRRFQECLDQIAERMQYGEQESITAVLGPTASGKTALVREFKYQFSLAMEKVPPDKKSTLLCLELAAPEHGTFKWRDDLYVPALTALREPCAAKKINVDELRGRLDQGDTSAIYSVQRLTVAEHRAVLYEALERNRVKGVLLDEANHLRRPASRNGLFSQYDSLKSRSNSCKAHFVLLGTTELADIFEQSGPISKRVYPIWLSPYGENEWDLFEAGLGSIVDKIESLRGMKLRVDFSLTDKRQEFREGTLGLLGLGHEWFDRALVRSIRLGKTDIKWRDMEAVALHPRQIVGIVQDLIQYNRAKNEARVYFKEHLRSLFSSSGIEPSTSKAKGRNTARPGHRRPTRDPVGL